MRSRGGGGGLPILQGIVIRFLVCNVDWSSKRHIKDVLGRFYMVKKSPFATTSVEYGSFEFWVLFCLPSQAYLCRICFFFFCCFFFHFFLYLFFWSPCSYPVQAYLYIEFCVLLFGFISCISSLHFQSYLCRIWFFQIRFVWKYNLSLQVYLP